MYKVIRNFVIGLILFVPVIVMGSQVPERLGQFFPVYGAPTNVIYNEFDAGLEISFKVEKEHECVIPKDKVDQDVFATLEFVGQNGDLITKPANVYPAEDNNRPLKNILIVGVPTNVGPLAVEVPDSIMSSLVSVDISILCNRPLLGMVYAHIGPFNIGDMTEKVSNN